jgi:hypothetical protein
MSKTTNKFSPKVESGRCAWRWITRAIINPAERRSQPLLERYRIIINGHPQGLRLYSCCTG